MDMFFIIKGYIVVGCTITRKGLTMNALTDIRKKKKKIKLVLSGICPTIITIY